MAALPVIADTYRCALNWRDAGGQIAENVIHIFSASGADTATAVFTKMNAEVGANMWLSVTDTASIESVSITPLDGSTATQLFLTGSTAGWTGGAASGDFSPATSALVKLTTALRGRSHRGRVYLPFTSESVMSDGLLSTGVATNISNTWTAFNAAMIAGSPSRNVVVASYKLSTDAAVTNFTCELALATQRRRQGRLRSS